MDQRIQRLLLDQFLLKLFQELTDIDPADLKKTFDYIQYWICQEIDQQIYRRLSSIFHIGCAFKPKGNRPADLNICC